ncbi:hypothetical protein HPB51_025515 [Rhipicephalus microplus]|uniref:FIST C-domain domain-containing protein n=1 Tax=Rhipicephalus microplus TaxID=6941 RepID=A0A9J6DE33_RHIMP|nr:hypothetical protein HPB51_025515 [Rhipicephalus microplus]
MRVGGSPHQFLGYYTALQTGQVRISANTPKTEQNAGGHMATAADQNVSEDSGDLESLLPRVLSITLFATDAFKSLVGLPVGGDAVDVKCVLWFTVNDVAFGENYQLMYDMVTDVVASCGMRRFALGGAVLEHMAVNNGLKGADHAVLCAGLSFSGDSVRAASKIVAPTVEGTDRVERELMQFRHESGFDSWDKSSTYGYMFACVARGARLHGKTNVESEVFSRVFPGVPLMGVFGNGEIGLDCVPTNGQKMELVRENCFHGYTTVFVLLSWSKCR